MTHSEYINNFVKKHGKGDWHTVTSPLRDDGSYIKTYVFDDGASITEVNGPVYETAEVEVRGVKCQVEVKLFRTECWNTDNSHSVFFYERW